MKEPTKKYLFETGKEIRKVKKKGYRYLGKGRIGELKTTKIDGNKCYYVDYDIGRSLFSHNITKFKQVDYWEEDIDYIDRWVELKKPKSKLVFNTKIETRNNGFGSIGIELGEDDIVFFIVEKSNIIRDLQLKHGDKLKVSIEKVEAKK